MTAHVSSTMAAMDRDAIPYENIDQQHHKLNPKILQLVQLFCDYEWVYNFKMTELLFDENLAKIPADVKLYFENLDQQQVEAVVNAIVQSQSEGCDNTMPGIMRTFVQTIHDIKTHRNQSHTKPEDAHSVSQASFFTALPRKWTKKKLDEVQHLAKFVGEMCVQYKCDLVIDIGSGLGYLSASLAEKYKIPVLAIESHPEKTSSAEAISSNFKAKGHGGGTGHKSHETESYASSSSSSHDITRANIKLTSDIANEISQFVTDKKNICITGLHACGDLTPWSMKLFLSDPKYKVLAIVPCCYHKMNFNVGDWTQNNFPLSDGLMNLLIDDFKVGKSQQANFLSNGYFCRLASQRLGNAILKDVENETKHVFYRGLLELYAQKESYEIRRVKRKCRFGKILLTFEHYLENTIGSQGGFELISTSKNLDSVPVRTYEDHCKNLHSLYNEKYHLLSLTSGLNAMLSALQHLAEELVLLDRLEYLLESGKVGQARIMRVIPSEITPRGSVIVATKLA